MLSGFALVCHSWNLDHELQKYNYYFSFQYIRRLESTIILCPLLIQRRPYIDVQAQVNGLQTRHPEQVKYHWWQCNNINSNTTTSVTLVTSS